MKRRSFFAAVAGAIAGARSKLTPKPTTGGLFNPHRDVYADYFGRNVMERVTTVAIRKPPQFITGSEISRRFEAADRAMFDLQQHALADLQFVGGETWGSPFLRRSLEYREPTADIPMVLASVDEEDEWE